MTNRSIKNTGEIPSFVVEAISGCSAETKAEIYEMLDVDTVTPQIIKQIIDLIDSRVGV